MIIRPYAPTDSVSRLTDLLHAAYKRLLDLGMKYVATVQEDAVTLDRLRQGHGFVVEDGGVLVGTILLKDPAQSEGCAWYDRPDVASFHQFAVDPARQGEGIGLALVRHVEGEALARGAKELALDTSEWAYHLVDWYGSLGYRIVDETQWEDVNYRSVIMSKTLGVPERDYSRVPLGRVREFLRHEPTAEQRDEVAELESVIERGSFTRRRHEVYGRLGDLYRMLREPAKALRYLEMAAAAAVERGDTKALMTQRLRAGVAYHYAGKHATANYVFARLVTAFGGDSERLGFVHQHFGKCLVEQDRFAEAMQHFRLAETYRAEEGVADTLRASTAEAIASLLNLMNRATYDRLAPGYAGDSPAEDDPAWRAACRAAFTQRLPGRHVMEIGCGPGTDSKFFADQGLDVLATDYCEPFLAIVKQRYPAMRTAWVDVTRPFDVGTFDGIYGNSCFLHVPRELAPQALEHLREALAPHGVLFLALISSSKTRQYTQENWGGEGNHVEFYCYDPAEMQELLEAAGYHDVEILELEWSPDSPYRVGRAAERVKERGTAPFQVVARRPAT
jgi:SAM-dependent methyltransferase/GNAT superfamily N-acetyltransferase